MFEKMPKLRIGEFVAKMPVIQGGMSVGVSLSRLASAVANQGGIGVIGAAGIGMLEPDFRMNYMEANQRALKREIRLTREKTDGLIGVNIMAALSDFNQLVSTAIEEMIDFIFIGAGLPLHLPKLMLNYNFMKHIPKIVPIVSSEKAARIIFTYWDRHYNIIPDAIVIEGPMAGGHLGFKKDQINSPSNNLKNILKEVLITKKWFEEKYNKDIPVIVAGGIFSGSDIYDMIKLGANGVQMGTRFVATEECDADKSFKDTYIACKKEDIVIIDSPVGMPGRAINNSFLRNVKLGKRKPVKCGWKCLHGCDFRQVAYCINIALTNAKMGLLEKGFAFAGANAYRVNEITSVQKLCQSLSEEYVLAAINDS
ncbi:MAG: nitronate monooxygenase [Caldisericia bacterium]|nr:nitronate monooxygenase [Caldisericia bacterium]